MNLVSYEFVACQNVKKGVLILSEVNIIHIYNHSLLCLLTFGTSKLTLAFWKQGCQIIELTKARGFSFASASWCSPVPGCWGYSGQSLEHIRCRCCNKGCFRHAGIGQRRVPSSQLWACHYTYSPGLGRHLCQVSSFKGFRPNSQQICGDKFHLWYKTLWMPVSWTTRLWKQNCELFVFLHIFP